MHEAYRVCPLIAISTNGTGSAKVSYYPQDFRQGPYNGSPQHPSHPIFSYFRTIHSYKNRFNNLIRIITSDGCWRGFTASSLFRDILLFIIILFIIINNLSCLFMYKWLSHIYFCRDLLSIYLLNGINIYLWIWTLKCSKIYGQREKRLIHKIIFSLFVNVLLNLYVTTWYTICYDRNCWHCFILLT